MTGEELLNIMNTYVFERKPYWKSILVAILPEKQVNEPFLILLINIFQKPDEYIYIYRMLDYLKYETVFDTYKKGKTELENHNIITYLTSFILTKTHKTRGGFGNRFCSKYGKYFENQTQILKDAFLAQSEINSRFDYNGKELKSILDIDITFINDSLKNGTIGLGSLSKIRLKDINTSILWEYSECEELIEGLLLTILEKEKFSSKVEIDVFSLFYFRKNSTDSMLKMKSFILRLSHKYSDNERMVLMLIDIVYNNFRDWFVEYYREFLILNNHIEITKRINFDKSSTTIGSRVPVYQKKIEFYQDILTMINFLPNILDYSEHIDYFEQRITSKKQDIERELKIDFIDVFY